MTSAGQTLTLPNEFAELLVVMAVNTGSAFIVYTQVIPKEEMPRDQTYSKTFYTGHYYSSSNFGGAVAVVENGTRIKYGGASYNGAERGFVYTVYYR